MRKVLLSKREEQDLGLSSWAKHLEKHKTHTRLFSPGLVGTAGRPPEKHGESGLIPAFPPETVSRLLWRSRGGGQPPGGWWSWRPETECREARAAECATRNVGEEKATQGKRPEICTGSPRSPAARLSVHRCSVTPPDPAENKFKGRASPGEGDHAGLGML